MSAKIYSGIKGIDKPEIDLKDYSDGSWEKKEEKYTNKLREVCEANSKSKNVGKIIKFPVADGYAKYMVYSTRPLELIHLALDDCYQSEFAELLTAKKVTEMVERE